MTMPTGQPVNVAGDGSQVGVQAQHAYIDIDTVTIPGNVQFTVGQDASPEAKYRAGVENLPVLTSRESPQVSQPRRPHRS